MVISLAFWLAVLAIEIPIAIALWREDRRLSQRREAKLIPSRELRRLLGPDLAAMYPHPKEPPHDETS